MKDVCDFIKDNGKKFFNSKVEEEADWDGVIFLGYPDQKVKQTWADLQKKGRKKEEKTEG